MGYAIMFGMCFGCGRTFGFNPRRVPSVRDEQNVKQPLCSRCAQAMNKRKREAGLPEFQIPADAYEPVAEEEL